MIPTAPNWRRTAGTQDGLRHVRQERWHDLRFASRLAESTAGRVFFTAGRDLDRYVVWDYLSRRRELIH